MAKICPSCGKAELKELVPGINTCPNCRKIFRGKIPEPEKKEERKDEGLQDGKYFMDNTTLNPKWEVADCGITIHREPNKRWFAVLLCHPPDFPNMKYIRLSWWKKSINTHAGMFKIQDFDVVDNVIIALERFDALFDDTFNPKDNTSLSFKPIDEREILSEQEIELFDMTKRKCPKCGWKMDRSRNKRYYECTRCGEIIIIYQETPIVDILPETLPLSFSTNYPVNYYLPGHGITVKQGMADWKAILTIYAKENPEKRWLRFYWWQRNLQDYMSSQYSLGGSRGLKWDTKKGVQSPNIYDISLIRPLIDAIKQLKKEWAKLKGKPYKEITYKEGVELTPEQKFGLKKRVLLSKIPTKKTLKKDIAQWIVDIQPDKNYNVSGLVKNVKPDLLTLVEKIVQEVQGDQEK